MITQMIFEAAAELTGALLQDVIARRPLRIRLMLIPVLLIVSLLAGGVAVVVSAIGERMFSAMLD